MFRSSVSVVLWHISCQNLSLKDCPHQIFSRCFAYSCLIGCESNQFARLEKIFENRPTNIEVMTPLKLPPKWWDIGFLILACRKKTRFAPHSRLFKSLYKHCARSVPMKSPLLHYMVVCNAGIKGSGQCLAVGHTPTDKL